MSSAGTTLENLKQCPSCGNNIPAEFLVCPICGYCFKCELT